MQPDRSDELTRLAARSREGDRPALEELLRAIQPDIYKLAQRFLWAPADAEDATQEILLKIITRLTQFDGRSRFTTWAYRVATNHLLDTKKTAPRPMLTFDEFAADLADGLADGSEEDIHNEMMLAEVRIGCTLALLQCLGPEARISYILGEILDLDHQEAADVLAIDPSTFRKRLSRARAAVSSFMTGHCGLVDSGNACRCSRRVAKAQALGRVDPDHLVFAKSAQAARAFPQVLVEVRRLHATRRAAALYRAQEQAPASEEFAKWLRRVLEGQEAQRQES